MTIGYRPIPSCPGYRAGTDGTIIGPRGHLLRQATTGSGYRCFRFSRPGAAPVTYSSHVAICEAYHGRRPDGMEVSHLNGDPYDNRPANLAWKTRRDNMRDKRKHGTQPDGEQVHNAKLSEGAVRLIRQSTDSYATLARRFGVNPVTIRSAKLGLTWRHVEGMEQA